MCWPAGGAAGERAAGAGRRGDHRPGAARVLRDVPRAQRGARQDLLPRHPAAAARQAAATCTRCTASRATPTRSSTTSTGPDPRGAAQPGASAFLADLDAGDSTDPVGRAAVAHRAHLGHPARALRGVPCLDARWTSPSPTTRPTPTSRTYVYGSAAVIGLQMVPILEPLDPRRRATTRRPSARRSSCPTSSATSREDLAAAGSTCRRRTSTRFGVTRADLGRRSVADRRSASCCASRSLGPVGSTAAAEPGIDLLHPTSRRLHPHRVRALPRHPRRGREDRLPGASTGGSACRCRRLACRCRPCLGLVRARRARRRTRVEPPPPPHPPRQRLHAPARSRTAGPPPARRPPATPRIAGSAVRHDVAPGQPAVGQQLEEHDDRVRRPEHPPWSPAGSAAARGRAAARSPTPSTARRCRSRVTRHRRPASP